METSYQLTNLQTNIHPGYSVRQFKVENLTPYYAYVNRSTDTPNTTRSDYTVQPFSIFVSPSFVSTDLTVVVGGLSLAKGVAKLTTYDNPSQQPSNVPYTTSQFVGSFPGYPFITSANALSGTGLIVETLPPIQIDKFQNIFFIVRPVTFPVGFVDLGTFPIGIMFDESFVAYFPQFGGVKAHTPRRIGLSVSPKTVCPKFNAAIGASYIIDVIQTGDYIEDIAPAILPTITINGVGSAKEYFAAYYPYFIFGLLGNTAVNHDANVQLATFASSNYDINAAGIIYSTRAIHAIGAGPYLVPYRVFPVSDNSVIELTITNNLAGNHSFYAFWGSG